MKTNRSLLKSTVQILLFVFLLIIQACSKDEGSPDPKTGGSDNDQKIADVLAKGIVDDYPLSRVADTLEVSEQYYEEYLETGADGDINNTYLCTTKKISVLDGNGKFPLFNPNAEVIWPGDLLQGKTLSNNTPSTINVKRAGGTVSYNLINGNPVSASSVDEVKKSTIQIAMNEIVANDPNIVPANFQLEVEEVYSEEQMALEMGISYESFNINASANLSFSSEKTYNRVLVKLTQQYYTMSMDQINGLDDIFAPDVTGEDLAQYVQADNPATFISSVTYGRIFYMLVESTSSINELKARVEGTYQGFKNKVEGEVAYDEYNSLKEVKTKIIAYGGSAESAFSLTGVMDINTIGEKLAERTNIAEALPLSYVVKSVLEPSKTVGTKLATEFDAVICSLRGVRPPQGYSNLVGVFDDGIGAATAIAGSNAILFNGAGTEYVWFNGNTGAISQKFSIKDSNAPLGTVRYDAVGTGVLYIPGEIWLYDKGSLEFVKFKFDPAPYAGNNNTIPNSYIGTGYYGPYNTNEVHNADLGTGESFPFASVGFGAAAYLGYTKTTEQENYFGGVIVHNIYKFRHIYIERGPGNLYAYEDYIVDQWTKVPIIGSQTTGTDITRKWTEKRDFRDYEKSTWALDAVGAGCKVTLGNGDLKLLYFGTDSKTFFIRNDLYGAADGPYVID